ncbi:MAG: glucokinase [Gammaproteobacteria bacterium]|nr:glucokinase [Gammaproteobacteria bacterium]|tara:strand:- start:678 stop:1655 length:978 start_codon:yes stop_codon:yes gene_type:complete
MTKKTLLIGDIGGTNARFAEANSEYTSFDKVVNLKCTDFSSADDAIRYYLDKICTTSPDVICLAAAGPIISDTIQVTNNHWKLDAEVLKKDFNINRVRLLNDFEAAAYSITQFKESDLQPLGPLHAVCLPSDEFNVAIIGAGTGFGAAGLVCSENTIIPVVGEGGHISFAPNSKIQTEIFKVLKNNYDRVIVERLVSGPGIENIYTSLALIHNEECRSLTAKEIFEKAQADSDLRAVESVNIFFEILGQLAGDIALCMGARDGIFLAGGIVKRYPELLMQSKFRNAFESKGRQRPYMERIPTMLVTHNNPGLLGAAYCALNLSLD